MPKNKAFVCFCVDGQSDIDVMRNPFAELFDVIGDDDINIDFRYADFQKKNYGDLTSLKDVNPDNIEKMIYKYYFKKKDQCSGLGWNDLTYIIHIIDTDGAYIPDDCINEFSPEEELLADSLVTNNIPKNTLYQGDHISVRKEDKNCRTRNVDLMADRNKRKRKIIEHLLSIDAITIGKKTVKYKLYYFSSNLDHYLYGDANMTGPEKMRRAAEFSTFNGDAETMSAFFKTSKFSTMEDYTNSWRSLKKGCASLCRGTNLNLLIDEIQKSTLEDWL